MGSVSEHFSFTAAGSASSLFRSVLALVLPCLPSPAPAAWCRFPEVKPGRAARRIWVCPWCSARCWSLSWWFALISLESDPVAQIASIMNNYIVTIVYWCTSYSTETGYVFALLFFLHIFYNSILLAMFILLMFSFDRQFLSQASNIHCLLHIY